MTEVRDSAVVLKEPCVDIPTLKLDMKTEQTASFSARLIDVKKLNIQQNRVSKERSRLRLSIKLLSRRELSWTTWILLSIRGSIAEESHVSQIVQRPQSRNGPCGSGDWR
jgi:hypothetical protein